MLVVVIVAIALGGACELVEPLDHHSPPKEDPDPEPPEQPPEPEPEPQPEPLDSAGEPEPCGQRGGSYADSRAALGQRRPHHELPRVRWNQSDAGRERSATAAGDTKLSSERAAGRNTVLLADRRQERPRDHDGRRVVVHDSAGLRAGHVSGTAVDQRQGVFGRGLRGRGAAGGNGRLAYSLTPSKPGLTFDAGTRSLYGTPRQVCARRPRIEPECRSGIDPPRQCKGTIAEAAENWEGIWGRGRECLWKCG